MNDNTPKKQIMHKAQVSQGFEHFKDMLPQVDSFIVLAIVNSGELDKNGDALYREHVITGGCNSWEQLGMLDVGFDIVKDDFSPTEVQT